ncbi:hypothetical protein C8R45DRAFT_926597 [Mycena sanguinolenta]|nr:hypothetical protein C8R45DRAFT_926597 [Mycena sanguinolenta]
MPGVDIHRCAYAPTTQYDGTRGKRLMAVMDGHCRYLQVTSMSQNSVRAAALALRNVHSTTARTSTVIPSTLSPFDVPIAPRQSQAPQPDLLTRPLQPAAASAPTPPPTSPLTALVFEGPSGRRPVVRNYHELMSPRTAAAYPGSQPVVTIFEGPTHSSPQWRRPVSQSEAKSVRGVRIMDQPRLNDDVGIA